VCGGDVTCDAVLTDCLLCLSVCCVQHLCRQGRSAVQVTHDLDIFIVDCLDRVCAGDVTRDGVVNPVDLKTRITGRLHLRLANIGHMSDLKSSKLSEYYMFCCLRSKAVKQFSNSFETN